jgi:hypothetical protein
MTLGAWIIAISLIGSFMGCFMLAPEDAQLYAGLSMLMVVINVCLAQTELWTIN